MSKTSRAPFFHTWSAQQSACLLECAGADDFHLLTDEGESILDFSSLSLQASFGLRPSFITEAVGEQLRGTPMLPPKATFSLKRQTALALLEALDVDGGKIFYTTGGAEAVEHALRMARLISGRNLVAAREDCYHGATLGAISVSGDWRHRAGPRVEEWTVRLPHFSQDPLARKARETIVARGAENVGAVCLETITGTCGVETPPAEWYAGIQNICHEFSIKLILDEIACGFYRTKAPFAFHHFPDLAPDFVCLAKGITGGAAPLGAVWVAEKNASFFERKVLPCGMTNYAHPPALAAALSVCKHIRKKTFLQGLEDAHQSFQEGLDSLEKLPGVEEVRGAGLLACLELGKPLKETHFWRRGVSVLVKGRRIILAPALNMPVPLVRAGVEKIARALAESL